ncbi:hypothetical protein [Sphingobium agri]|uniref:Uncharacterized protein n=2 Tax=Sphingobium agri TaxID=2933566 RepID=A0ABT0DU92_9SPHN|nr:hypothetical protein [Sphingobium agri]
MRYVEGAIGFQLGRRGDVLQSWYGIDNGEPRRWRDQLPELARLRVNINDRDMDRPTGGMLWVPIDQLGDAKVVTIQRRPGSKPRQFSLDGFWRLHDYAITQGCTPESRFFR